VSGSPATFEALIARARPRAQTHVKPAELRPTQPPALATVEARWSRQVSEGYAHSTNADETASHASSRRILSDIFLKGMGLHIHRQTRREGGTVSYEPER
jgi:hypothetical protein